MSKAIFPFVIARNIGKKNCQKWLRFYKIKSGHRFCSKEEGLWRRTQTKINRDESGWRGKSDKRRRMIHYEHEFDVVQEKNSYNFCLVKTYTWIHLCLPQKEIKNYFDHILLSLRSNKFWLPKIQKDEFLIYQYRDLSLEIKQMNHHPQDIKAKRSFPKNYQVLELKFYSNGNKKRTNFSIKPWLVLNTGIRKKDVRGKPLTIKNIKDIVQYLPAQLELGGGASVESGIYPLNFLHKVYSVSDKNKKFVFTYEKDKLAQVITANPQTALSSFCIMHKKILFAKINLFYQNLKRLYKKGYFVGPVLTNNFDGLVRQIGLKERYIRKYSDDINPKIRFHKKAKSLIAIGVHADRRQVQKQARKKGLKVIYIDTEGYRSWYGKLAPYPLESPQDNDIVIQKPASRAFSQLEKLLLNKK